MKNEKKSTKSLEKPIINEEQLSLAYDFAYYIENLPGKAGCGGAIELLRKFLRERNNQ